MRGHHAINVDQIVYARETDHVDEIGNYLGLDCASICAAAVHLLEPAGGIGLSPRGQRDRIHILYEYHFLRQVQVCDVRAASDGPPVIYLPAWLLAHAFLRLLGLFSPFTLMSKKYCGDRRDHAIF